jgi:hypothetical protein
VVVVAAVEVDGLAGDDEHAPATRLTADPTAITSGPRCPDFVVVPRGVRSAVPRGTAGISCSSTTERFAGSVTL